MSEYYCSGPKGRYTGCNDCGGLRILHSGKAPKGMKNCYCRPRWNLFTKRTNDPKLAWLEAQLLAAGIKARRNGESWHAPILEVKERDMTRAWEILSPVDDIPDDDPMFIL